MVVQKNKWMINEPMSMLLNSSKRKNKHKQQKKRKNKKTSCNNVVSIRHSLYGLSSMILFLSKQQRN